MDNKHIGVGVITAPRFGKSVLLDTLRSIRSAGFASISLFSQSDLSDIPWDAGELITSIIDTRSCGHGAYTNWRAGLEKMVEITSPGELIMMCEDDIEMPAGTANYLGSFSPSMFHQGVFSLYCEASNTHWFLSNPNSPDFGWFRLPPDRLPNRSYGALCYLMSKSHAEQFLAAPPLPHKPHGTDHAMGLFCKQNQIPLYLHSPSLIRHRGEATSTIGAGSDSYRQASHWVRDIAIHNGQRVFDIVNMRGSYGAPFAVNPLG